VFGSPHTCGLLFFKKGIGYALKAAAWQDALSEYFLKEVEISITQKKEKADLNK
jgi:hypothetical protein